MLVNTLAQVLLDFYDNCVLKTICIRWTAQIEINLPVSKISVFLSLANTTKNTVCLLLNNL